MANDKCVPIVKILYETAGLQPVKPLDACKIPTHKIADMMVPQRSSPWNTITDVKLVLYTWNFRVDHWDHRCEKFVRNQIDMLKGWVESGQETRIEDWRLKGHRWKRDVIATALGEGQWG